MGVRPREMREMATEIAEFTELGHYLDMPVRTYSAGMMIRLAFAIATCIPPDILIMDEWLTAGDAKFLEKAQRRIEGFVRASSILVLASHSMGLVDQWCNRGILLSHGQIVAMGSVKEAINAYQQLVESETVAAPTAAAAAE
jgi:ABC-type polysaccharide/polyol phosphate transport system ATPase subunit